MHRCVSFIPLTVTVVLAAGATFAAESEIKFGTQPTILFVEKEGQLRQLVQVDVQ